MIPVNEKLLYIQLNGSSLLLIFNNIEKMNPMLISVEHNNNKISCTKNQIFFLRFMINIKLEYYFYYESKRSRTRKKNRNQHLKHKKSCLCKTDFFSKARWNFVELTEKHFDWREKKMLRNSCCCKFNVS